MSYQSTNSAFESLTDEEEKNFRIWTRIKFENGTQLSPLWHPVCKEEFIRLQMEDAWDKEQHNEDLELEDNPN